MTPEEIVALIGNIGNRPDIREVQERQVKEIKAYTSSILEQLVTLAHMRMTELSLCKRYYEKPPEPVPVPEITPTIDFMRENQLNAMEKEIGGEMSEEELAKHFNESVPERKVEKPFNEMSMEEIKAWESKQDNSNDIYKVSARIKNLARGGGANLTPAGDVLCNSYTHVMKAFYDFAASLQDGAARAKLHQLIRSNESMPGNVIAALNAGVKQNG